MYYGKKNIFNTEKHQAVRNEVVGHRNGAVWIAFEELDGIINPAALARDYFDESTEWIEKKISGSMMERKNEAFNAVESGMLADAMRDIARRLVGLADEIDKVKNID